MRQKPLKSGFLSPAALNRGTMDDKRSGRSCRHLLVTQTLPLGQTFYPSNPFKTSFLFPPLPPGYTYIYMISQCWEGPLCAGTSPASQSYLFPNFLAEAGTCRPGPHNHECPPHLDLSCPQKRPKSDGQHGIHVTTSPRIWIIQQEILGLSFFRETQIQANCCRRWSVDGAVPPATTVTVTQGDRRRR